MTNDKREFVPRVPWEILNSSLSFAPSCTVNVTTDVLLLRALMQSKEFKPVNRPARSLLRTLKCDNLTLSKFTLCLKVVFTYLQFTSRASFNNVTRKTVLF